MVEATAQVAQPYPKPDPRNRLYDAQVSNLLDGKVGRRQVTSDGIVPFSTAPGSGADARFTCHSAINWRFVTLSASTVVSSALITTTIAGPSTVTSFTTAATSTDVRVTHDLGRKPVSFMMMGNVASTVGISSTRTDEWNATQAFFNLGTSATSDPYVYSVVLL